VEQGHVVPQCNRGDAAVVERPGRLTRSPARTVEGGRAHDTGDEHVVDVGPAHTRTVDTELYEMHRYGP